MESLMDNKPLFRYNSDKSDVPIGVSTTTLDYLQAVINSGTWDLLLDEREKTLITQYFTKDISLEDLKPTARVRSTERVRQIISSALVKPWPYLLEDERQKYPLEDIKKLKNKTALSNSPENQEIKRQRSRARWEQIYNDPKKWNQISSAMKHGHTNRKAIK